MLLCVVCLLCIVYTSSTDQELHTLIQRIEKKIAMLEMELSDLRLWKSDFEKSSKGDLEPLKAQEAIEQMMQNHAFWVFRRPIPNLKITHSKRKTINATEGFESGVAFSAYISKSFKAASFGNSREIVYDKIECNVGNGYDNNTGTFRAPIKGMYAFTWSVCGSCVDQGEIGVELLIYNQIHGSVWVDSEQISDEDCSTGFVIHTLNAGDVVFTRSHPAGIMQGSVRSDQYMRTTFSEWVLF